MYYSNNMYKDTDGKCFFLLECRNNNTAEQRTSFEFFYLYKKTDIQNKTEQRRNQAMNMFQRFDGVYDSQEREVSKKKMLKRQPTSFFIEINVSVCAVHKKQQLENKKKCSSCNRIKNVVYTR